MNKKAIIITVSSLALLGAGIGVWMYFRKKSSDKAEIDEFGVTEEEIEKSGGGVGAVDDSEYASNKQMKGSDMPLKIGSKGRRVAMLQALLNHYEGRDITVDGAFGNETRWALLKSGFPMCSIANQCEVNAVDFVELLKKTKSDKSFAKKYNPKSHEGMKKVYEKYSSARGSFGGKVRDKYQCFCEKSKGHYYSQACNCNEGDKELGRMVIG
jgi:hypothetical protein